MEIWGHFKNPTVNRKLKTTSSFTINYHRSVLKLVMSQPRSQGPLLLGGRVGEDPWKEVGDEFHWAQMDYVRTDCNFFSHVLAFSF